MPRSPQRVSPARVWRRVVEYLNTALLSPQMLYLTSQPNALTVSFVVLGKQKKKEEKKKKRKRKKERKREKERKSSSAGRGHRTGDSGL